MNVIFLDFDGVIDTNYYKSYEDMEEKILILSKICHTYNAKVVIEASAKDAIDEETLEVDSDSKWIKFIFEMFKKYNIECIGRTPNVIKKYSNNCYTSIWKEDEIRLYLFRHPEIEHYCIIDDDDLSIYNKSDLKKVKEHLVKTEFYLENNPKGEGLTNDHIDLVGEVLKRDNKIKKYALKRKEKNHERLI